MKIGPVDIRNHSFSRKMRGVDEAEVRAYLDLLADRLEEAIGDSAQVREAVDRANVEIREYRSMERTLRESLVAAERVTEERLGLAEKEARLIVKNAEVEAEKILAQARETGARYRVDIEDLRRQRTTFLERFRALLSSQSKILEASAREFETLGTETRTEAKDARTESRSEIRTEPRPEPRFEPRNEPRFEPRGPAFTVPFEPASSRSFEPRQNPWRPAEPPPLPTSPHVPVASPAPAAHRSLESDDGSTSGLFSYLGEEGLFNAPPVEESTTDERRSD